MKCCAVVLLACAVLTPRAFAQTEGEDAHQRAVVLFEESARLYDAGDFEAAVVLLRQAYEHEANPGILFNLARSLEGLGAPAEAADTYERYLEESNPDDRGAIEARVRTLRDQAERLERADSNAENEELDPPAPPLDAREPVTPPPAAGASPLPWVIAGVGVLAVGAGVIFGVRSTSLSDDAAAEAQMQRAVDLHESAESSALLANIFLIGGGVLAAVGVTWGIIDAAKSGGPSVQARITPGGVIVEGTF